MTAPNIFRNDLFHNEFTGDATRKCSSTGEWEASNLDHCVDKVYEDILDEVCQKYSFYHFFTLFTYTYLTLLN